MKIQFNTDKKCEGDQRVEAYFSAELEKELADLRRKLPVSRYMWR
jgi:hypothetical protein